MLSEWLLCIIFGSIGFILLAITYAALIISRREGRYVSGCPCIGGLFIFAAFMLSPCKWLAVLCLLDYGVWELPYLMISEHIKEKKLSGKSSSSKNDHPEQ